MVVIGVIRRSVSQHSSHAATHARRYQIYDDLLRKVRIARKNREGTQVTMMLYSRMWGCSGCSLKLSKYD
jgi:hypothetical protein